MGAVIVICVLLFVLHVSMMSDDNVRVGEGVLRILGAPSVES